MEKLTVNFDGKPCYDIVFTDGFDGLADSVSSLGFRERRIAVITESTVGPLYADAVIRELDRLPGRHVVFTFPAGEENKQLKTLEDIYAFLIEEHFDRHDLLIALGGGVTGDITGFAAASFLRGISFIQIPTTLLSQCDSSIGGKTGVDFRGFKNMIGAFYMPALVWMNLSVLKTLSERQYIAGFAEVIKYGMICDGTYFDHLVEHRQEILDRDIDVMVPVIRRSCEIKRAVVEEDPREQGIRAILNFGHTIGHAIEKYRDFQLFHGECVSLGMHAAAAVSVRAGLLAARDGERIESALESFRLPVRFAHTEEDVPAILKLVRSDKKADGGHVRFVFLDSIGNAVRGEISDDLLRYGLETLR
ncbi:MAG: 3-dehydroquinate synthase [Lachnospiraceae bacterium]|nr:3-dehydroquinate synthase [Lachnospiraceae bacterium]